MSFSLGWNARDAEGRRVKMQFDLVRQNFSWKIKPARFERWEVHEPTEQDWEALFEVIDRHLARGKVSHEDSRLIRKLHRDGHA